MSKELMTLKKGAKITYNGDPNNISGVEVNKQYTFLGYDESNIPKNRQNAVMTWYPDRPIWSEEEYEDIRFKFMMVKLEGVEKPQWLKEFKLSS